MQAKHNFAPERGRSSRVLRAVAATLGGLGLLLVGCHGIHIDRLHTEYEPGYWERTEAERTEEERGFSGSTRAILEDSAGCVSCHNSGAAGGGWRDAPHTWVKDPHPQNSHATCVQCHGGDGHAETLEEAHPHPLHREGHGGHAEEVWPEREGEHWPSSANPERSYVKLNSESLDWIRFVNPGDLRVAHETCGPCHDRKTGDPDQRIVLNVQKSIMTTASHFWGVAAYANGIVSNKRSVFGESYSANGVPQAVLTQPWPPVGETIEQAVQRGVQVVAAPLPNFEAGQTGNVFRVFETGSRLGGAALAFNGLPIPLIGLPDKFEDLGGRPNNKLSDRGLGTLNRVDLPLLNIFKTRLNDPFLYFLGTNDQPGDYRSSGCTGCHVVYANNRDAIASGPYARFGNRGFGNAEIDPLRRSEGRRDLADYVRFDKTIPSDESGHPITHEFTRAIPSSQCMVCHHHQPNSFVNSFLGYTMWVYDTDGERMWPEEQADPDLQLRYDIMMRNPEGAAQRSKWGYDWDFMADSARDMNAGNDHTQFADYHGHGWIFRGVFKMDREGQLLDRDGALVDYDDPQKFEGVAPLVLSVHDEPPTGREIYPAEDPKNGIFAPKPGRPVHMRDIHAERGMHCVDCHWKRDNHGYGELYDEYQAAVEISCQDCHGSLDSNDAPADGARDYHQVGIASLLTTGPTTTVRREADGSIWSTNERRRRDMRQMRTPFGSAQFGRERDDEGRTARVIQRSMLYPDLEWEVPQLALSENGKARNAHLALGRGGDLAHGDGKLECYACHTSWITSCFGCHLPQQANWKTKHGHYEDLDLRNFAEYNPQVVRDSEFMLGKAGDVKGNRITPVRSSSGVLISSQDAQRQKIYGAVPPIGANGMSSQLFNTHFPHTVRLTETKDCSDCHVSPEGDNNAWMAQTFLLGTNQFNFMGHNVFVGEGEAGFSAVQATEWEDPQAVLGSHLHAMAFPDNYAEHMRHDQELQVAWKHHTSLNALGRDIQSVVLRGEYLYTASGEDGFRVYDVANVNNKGFSLRVITAPFSPMGQDTHVSTPFATAVALPTNQHISMSRTFRSPREPAEMDLAGGFPMDNREQAYVYDGKKQNMHELYRYAYVSDLQEGLVVVDIDSLTDFDPSNNFIEKVVSFNPDGVLDGARNLTVAGETVYVCCDAGLVAVSIDDPRAPRVIASVGADHVQAPTAVEVQFRYAFVTDAEGLKVLDVTDPSAMSPVASLAIDGARDIYVAKTYAYISAGAAGLVVVDVERPLAPALYDVERMEAFNREAGLTDLYEVKVAMTNDTVFAYMADGVNGLKIAKIYAPNDASSREPSIGGRSAYGFSPPPNPELVARHATKGPAKAVAKGLERDRAVDESGNQMTLFGFLGARPFTLEEMWAFYVDDQGRVYSWDEALERYGLREGWPLAGAEGSNAPEASTAGR